MVIANANRIGNWVRRKLKGSSAVEDGEREYMEWRPYFQYVSIFFIQGKSAYVGPYKSCIIWLLITTSYRSDYCIVRDFSVNILWMPLTSLNLSSQSMIKKICAWGRLHFWNLIVNTSIIVFPSIYFLSGSFTKTFNLRLKIWKTTSEWSVGLKLSRIFDIILSYFRLHVNVMKKST